MTQVDYRDQDSVVEFFDYENDQDMVSKGSDIIQKQGFS